MGQVVGAVSAVDGDGSSPFNVVSYALDDEGSSDRAGRYFAVDESTGEISVKDDLTKELYDEYRVRDRIKNIHRTNKFEIKFLCTSIKDYFYFFS